MPKPLFILLVLIVFQACSTRCAFTAQSWQPGFRTLGIWNEDPRERLDLNIWYPSLRQAQEMRVGPWKIRGAHNAKPADGPFPLIILSHATPANRFSYADLGSWLASRGFIVAAPTHTADNLDNMDDLLSWSQLSRRTGELRQALDAVLKDKDLGPAADPGRIGLLGFGAGATAALLLGGAIPNCDGLDEWRKAHCPDDYYCGGSLEKINRLCENFPIRKSLADQRVKAVAAIAPAFGMLFNSASTQWLYPPVLLGAAGKDKLNAPAAHSERIGRLLAHNAFYLDLPEADAGALLDECPPALAAELPELCQSVDASARNRIRGNLSSALLSFFDRFLNRDLRAIPAPPELAPQPEPQKAVKPKAGRDRKRRGRQ